MKALYWNLILTVGFLFGLVNLILHHNKNWQLESDYVLYTLVPWLLIAILSIVLSWGKRTRKEVD